MKISTKQFFIYLVVTFVLSWLLMAIAIPFGTSSPVFVIALAIAMFMPLVGGIAAKGGIKNIGWKPKVKGNVKRYLIAWFLPSICCLLGILLFFLICPNLFSLNGAYIKDLFIEAGLESQLDDVPMILLIALPFLEAFTFTPFINAIPAVGEEAGWRGVMYPYLKDKLGTTWGRIVGGIIWGIWHYPIIIFSDYEYGSFYLGQPYLGLFAFTIFTIVVGIIADSLYTKSESIWSCALLHGSINAVLNLGILLLGVNAYAIAAFGPRLNGLITMIPLIVCAIIINVRDVKKEKKHKEEK